MVCGRCMAHEIQTLVQSLGGRCWAQARRRCRRRCGGLPRCTPRWTSTPTTPTPSVPYAVGPSRPPQHPMPAPNQGMSDAEGPWNGHAAPCTVRLARGTHAVWFAWCGSCSTVRKWVLIRLVQGIKMSCCSSGLAPFEDGLVLRDSMVVMVSLDGLVLWSRSMVSFDGLVEWSRSMRVSSYEGLVPIILWIPDRIPGMDHSLIHSRE